MSSREGPTGIGMNPDLIPGAVVVVVVLGTSFFTKTVSSVLPNKDIRFLELFVWLLVCLSSAGTN